MNKNSFKELEALQIKERGNGSSITKKNISANINLFGFISELIQLYLPNAGSVLKSFDLTIPSQDDKKQNKYPNK
ncbi:MAG: hypothetical protein U0T36_06665 [Saprospiraceae bacterium]